MYFRELSGPVAHLLHPAQAGGSRGSEQLPGVARVEESAPVQREEGDCPVQPLGHHGREQGGDSQGNKFLNTYCVYELLTLLVSDSYVKNAFN